MARCVGLFRNGIPVPAKRISGVSEDGKRVSYFGGGSQLDSGGGGDTLIRRGE